MEALLARIAAAAGRHRRWFLGAWVALLVAAVPFASQAQGKLSAGGFEVPGSQSKRLGDFYDRLPAQGSLPFTLLVDAPTAAAARSRLRIVERAAAARHPELNFRLRPFGSPDGTAMAVTGYAALSQDEGLRLAGQLDRELQVTHGPLRTFVLGPSATYHAFQRAISDSLAKAETITLPVVAAVLLALFGALVAATLPLMLGAVCVGITFGMVFFVATQTTVSIFATTMISMIGIGVAVDYSLFVLARYREELAAGAAADDAVRIALRTSGTAVVFSGITVILSLLSILLVPVRAVQSMAAAAALVTAVSVLAAATFLPALLHLLGPRVNRGRIWRRAARADATAGSGFWVRWSERVMRRPLVSFVGAALLLGGLTIPAFTIETDNRALEQISRSDPIRVGSTVLTSKVTGPGRGREGALSVLVRGRDGRQPPPLAATRALAASIARDPLIAGTTIETPPGAVLIVAPIRVDPEGGLATETIVPRVRRIVASSGITRTAIVDVGGVAAFNHDLNSEVGGDLWKVIVFVVCLAYVVLLVLLRSVLLPLKAVVMNLLSIGAAYGVVVMIFQYGWLDWLGYHHLGHLNTLNPALILAITFGLSMDYEVFLLSRIKERYESHGSNERAVAEGIASSARIITSAAAIMVVVFSAFALTGVPTIKEIGVGLAFAIAVDATVTRLILVPATMRLLGDWNWWLPAWLDRLLPSIGHEARRPQPVGD